MRNPLPTSGLDLPCAVPNFTGIQAVIAQPAYSVITKLLGFDRGGGATKVGIVSLCFQSHLTFKKCVCHPVASKRPRVACQI